MSDDGFLNVLKSYLPEKWTKARPLVPVLRFTGPIGMSTPLKPSLTLTTAALAIEKAFSMRGAKAAVVSVRLGLSGVLMPIGPVKRSTGTSGRDFVHFSGR